MKINVLSDLHLAFDGMQRPTNDADLVILAGDIARPQESAAWALGFDKPVIYVPGNHEFYGGSIDGTPRELKRLLAGTHVHVLDDDAVVLGGIRFLGSTLWTDFGLFESHDRRAAALVEASRLMRDFSRIRLREQATAVFTPADSIALFQAHAAWLEARIRTAHAGPTVVITHHAPSPGSIHPRFADSLLNACFVSDAEHLLGAPAVSVWIHGHTHDSFDYRVRGTRVICNPRGYARDGIDENPLFDPDFAIEVGPSDLPADRSANP